MKYINDNGNVCVHLIDHPDDISHFFKDSNLIGIHNQVHHNELALEKCWVSTDTFLCHVITLIGINMVDCWKLAQYHKEIHQNEMSIVRFVCVLGKQLSGIGQTITMAGGG